MKYLFIILMFAVSAFAANVQYQNGIKCDCDSIHVEYYASGIIVSEIPYHHGKINGIAKYYEVYFDNDSASSKLVTERTYANGIPNGTEYDYYKSGAIMWEMHYTNGKIGNSSVIHYNENPRNKDTYKSILKNGICSAYRQVNSTWELIFRGIPSRRNPIRCPDYYND